MATALAPGNGAAGQRAPYTHLAPEYDRLVGDALYPTVRSSFEGCVRELGLGFGSAADVGCGTGRFLLDLARDGVAAIGVDRSPAMLRIAARRLRGTGVLLLRQDMRRLRLPRRVDLITCNGDTLNYLVTPDELASTLLRCRAHLRPGGHLVADLLSGRPTPGDWRTTDIGNGSAGRISLWWARSDAMRRMTRVAIDFGRRGPSGDMRWAREVHVQRWHSPSEIEKAVERAGLEVALARPLQMGGDHRRSAVWIKIVLRRAPPRKPSAENRTGRSRRDALSAGGA